MTTRKTTPFNGKVSWNPHGLRVAMAEKDIKVPELHRRLIELSSKFGFQNPSLSWCYSYLSQDGAKGPTNPGVTRALCEILGIRQKALYKKRGRR